MFNNRAELSTSAVCLALVATLAITIGLIEGARSINAQINYSECRAQGIGNCDLKASF